MNTWKKLRPWSLLAALTLFLVVLMTGCSDSSDDNAESGETVTVESVDGPVEIPADPQRIVALRGSAEALLSLGSDNVVGVPDLYTEDYFGEDTAAWEKYQSLPKVGTIAQPDYEAILALEPDLIVGNMLEKHWETVDKEKLKAIAPVVNLEGGSLLVTDWYETFDEAAGMAGMSEQAQEQKDQFHARADEIHQKYADKIDGKKFVAVASWSPGTFWDQNSGTYVPHKLEAAGLTFPTAEGQERSYEQLGMLADYDVIVYPVKPDGSATPEVQAMLDSELFKSLPAVQAGRVLAVAYTDPFTYSSGMASLNSLDEQLAKLPQQ
ncbi:ABC transporter substrate-binding protein [Williamsia soli]|uniref:ABC transporter substrate-binding protein n=1 Tax=Williamsia soli TaxID=364929 RepID=UPI001A9CF107|nr:ABC transporter substrate-binding protein [Williamsia soli]